MKMNRLICKVDFPNKEFIKGKSYEYKENKFLEIVYVKPERGINKRGEIIFGMDIFRDGRYIWNFFYTEKELRKMKLNEIKEHENRF